MARYTGAKCKLCRREGMKLFLKGERCYSSSCAIERRPYGPGEHGRRRGRKPSDYKLQLREKQKVRAIYGVLERQFRLYFAEANRRKGATGENLFNLLEKRLDNVIYRLGLAPSRSSARQLIRHKHVMVEDGICDIPSRQVRVGQTVSIRTKSHNIPQIVDSIKDNAKRDRLPFLETDEKKLSGRLLSEPQLSVPEGVKVEKETQSDTFAELDIAPLERGFGHTLGNALRRTLLSSIHGHGVTAVKIEGVKHELSTVPGVLEDVTDIVLNLKNVTFGLSDAPSGWAAIDATGPGVVTAGLIEGHPELEIANPDHVICTLTEGEDFSARVYIDTGRGYVDRENHIVPDEVIGVIRMDTNFSPVRKVSYRVEDTRVGQRTDYDKLVLGITTNGAVRPEDAIGFSAKILKDQLQMFINFDEAPIDAQEVEVNEEQERIVELLSRNVEELELSVRSANCLKSGHIKTLFDLVTKSEQEMLKFRNFGRKSLNEIGEILEGMELSFGMAFPPEVSDLVRENAAT